MLTRLRDTRTRNVLAIGAVVMLAGLLFLPGIASAKTAVLKFVGIQGITGNQADVTPANQLLTTNALPNNLISNLNVASVAGAEGSSELPILSPPNATSAEIVDHVTVTTKYMQGPVGADANYVLFVGPSNCSTFVVTPNQAYTSQYFPTGTGYASETDLNPGVPVPAGDAFCIAVQTTSTSSVLDVEASATGIAVPASSVQSGTEHPASASLTKG
jgi:hypothetical protein